MAMGRQRAWKPLVERNVWQEYSINAETLVFFDVGADADPFDYTIRPKLAESWEFKDNGTTVVFQLRKGVKWGSSGYVKVDETRDVTAHDWVSVAEISLGEQVSQMRPKFIEIDGPESWRAIDDYTLEIKLNGPSAALLSKLAITGPMLWNTEVVRDRMAKEGLSRVDALTGPQAIIGTGPWVLKEHIDQFSNGFERNPNYWGEDKLGNRLPFADQVEIAVIKDQRVQDAGFITGKIDVIGNDGCGISKERYESIKKAKPDTQFQVFPDCCNRPVTKPSFAEGSAFHDIRVRRAMQLALNKEGWIKSALGGWGFPWSTPLTVGNEYWLPPDQYTDVDGDGIPGSRYLDFDQAAALELMKEAGYGPDNPLKVRWLMTTAGGDRFLTESEFQAEAYRQIGIEPVIEVKGGADWLAAAGAGDFDLTYSLPGYGWDPSDWILKAYHSANTKSQVGPAALNDPILDQMIELEERQVDPAERFKHVADIQRYLMEKQYYIYGPSWAMTIAWQSSLQNYQWRVRAVGEALAVSWIEQ